MVKSRAWPVKAMYLLIAAALAISLVLIAAPPQKASSDCTADVCAEWERVNTPTMDGWVLAPQSTIIDACYADDGEVAYAVVYAYDEVCDAGSPTGDTYRLLKSDDYGATWSDLTDAIDDVDEGYNLTPSDNFYRVATDWADPEFVAVALLEDAEIRVYFSTDGGGTFEDIGEVEDGGVYLQTVSDLAVSPESGGAREIAIGGQDDGGEAALFRSTVTGDSASGWEDATDWNNYSGWDDEFGGAPAFTSIWVTDIIFSSSWGTDKTILVTTIVDAGDPPYDVYLQCGSWGTSEAWNADSTVGIDAVEIIDDVFLPMYLASDDARAIAGITLPEDYNSKNDDDRVLWTWVNHYDPVDDTTPMCSIMRVEDDSADPVGPMGQIEDGEVWLTNISYKGTIAEGEAMAGLLGTGSDAVSLLTTCCEGVQVYRNDGIVNMDICCERWHKACKPPTGQMAMGVAYVDDDKAYAVALQGTNDYEEGAVSVTFDDGDTWNQLSLIDTYISYVSDVAVSPDCNKTFLATVNDGYGCGCDSVWLHAEDLPEAEEYSGEWLRTWCGELIGDNSGDFPGVTERSLLRLAPEETTGDTVFLVDRQSDNVYWNDLETLACWDQITCTEISYIVDLAAQDADTVFALGDNAYVSMFDDDEWDEGVDSDLTNGWSIVVWDNHILVGGQDGDVSYSDDDGETFEELEDVDDSADVYVNLAFDSYFDQNDTIYAALAHAYDDNGIYVLVIGGETDEWTKLAASNDFNYTGIKLDNAAGNPMTGPDTGGVLYASFFQWWPENCDYDCAMDDVDQCWQSGVARCLMPIVELCCDIGQEEWDYISWGLEEYIAFTMQPQALKMCGCLTADSNTRLFAIDDYDYDTCEGLDGTVWTFEDCYSKVGVDLNSPADGYVVGADVCECINVPFTISWDRLCDACCYEIQFAMDEDFTDLYDGWWICPDTPTEPSEWIGDYFNPETTYYWRIRAIEAETCQDIRSWWSEGRSFTVSPTASAAAIHLVSPELGATGIAIKNLGFSWNLMASADEFDWVLSKNADLSSPEESQMGLESTAYQCTKTLAYDTTYYWQVTAYNEGSAISTSAIGTFRTQTEAEADVEPPPPPTPVWVWVVIAIGAVLVIVVIVLIFRTRRV